MYGNAHKLARYSLNWQSCFEVLISWIAWAHCCGPATLCSLCITRESTHSIPMSIKHKYEVTTKTCCSHTFSTESICSMYSVGWDCSRLARHFSLASGDFNTEALEAPRGDRHTEAQQKCCTPGERMMKTKGSMMEFKEMKRRALRSEVRLFWPVEFMYTRIWETREKGWDVRTERL